VWNWGFYCDSYEKTLSVSYTLDLFFQGIEYNSSKCCLGLNFLKRQVEAIINPICFIFSWNFIELIMNFQSASLLSFLTFLFSNRNSKHFFHLFGVEKKIQRCFQLCSIEKRIEILWISWCLVSPHFNIEKSVGKKVLKTTSLAFLFLFW